MLTFRNSYIYRNVLDKEGAYTKKIVEIMSGNEKEIINDCVSRSISDLSRTYSTNVLTQKAVTALQRKDIILTILPPRLVLAQPMPFFKFKDAGRNRVYVDVTRFAKKISKEGEKKEYTIDFKILYTLAVSSLVTLELVEETGTLAADIIKNSGKIWAAMFCKVLNKMIGLSTNPDRYHAYMYMAIKFYCIHLMGAQETFATSIANSYINDYTYGKGENAILKIMQDVIKMRRMEPFKDIVTFTQTLFNEEVGNLDGLKTKNISESMNTYEYIRSFINMYGFASVMSLASFPYFLMTLISADIQDDMVNYRSLKDIVKEDYFKEFGSMISGIIKNIR